MKTYWNTQDGLTQLTEWPSSRSGSPIVGYR